MGHMVLLLREQLFRLAYDPQQLRKGQPFQVAEACVQRLPAPGEGVREPECTRNLLEKARQRPREFPADVPDICPAMLRAEHHLVQHALCLMGGLKRCIHMSFLLSSSVWVALLKAEVSSLAGRCP